MSERIFSHNTDECIYLLVCKFIKLRIHVPVRSLKSSFSSQINFPSQLFNFSTFP